MITVKDLNDEWFFKNGYWKSGDEGTVIMTEKWRKLMNALFPVEIKKKKKIMTGRRLIEMRKIKIVTPEALLEAINNSK